MAEISRLADFEMRVGSWYWVRPERRATMEVEKIRNLSDEELALEERKASEQLFRLRFQMKLGQTEGVKKLRELKKDVARINTISRERELGIHSVVAPKHHAEAEAEAATPAKHAKKTLARDGTWLGARWLNGDQTHQGRHIQFDDQQWTVQRITLYRY